MGDHLPPASLPDAKDRAILYELEQDSRQSLGKIARKVRLSKQTLHYRIERLKQSGLISQFITAIDVSRLGLVNHEVWIQLDELSLEKKKTFLDFLVSHPNTRWVASCGGKFDVAIAILAENLVQFNSIFRAILKEFPGFVKNYFVSLSYEMYSYPRTYLAKTAAKRVASFLGGEPRRIQMDEADIRILSLLSKNSRIPTIEIAKKAGIAANTVRVKIKRLENEGVIQAYTTITQPSKIGVLNYEILVSLQNLTQEKETQVESYCLLNKNITFLLKVVGKWDIDIAFDARSTEHFQEFLLEFRSRFADVIKDFEFVQILYVHKFDYLPMK